MKVKFEMEISDEESLELFKTLCGLTSLNATLKEERTIVEVPTVGYRTEPCTIHTPTAPISEVAQYHVGVDLASTPDQTVVDNRVVKPLDVVTNYTAPYAMAQPVVTAPVETVAPVTAPVPTANPCETYTLEQLAVAASTQLVDAGRRNELIDLLGLFGIQSMAQLPLESYGLFATHLRSKGVRI